MAKIKVQFGQLTKPLEVLSIDEQTTLEQFCKTRVLHMILVLELMVKQQVKKLF
jgi:hypothetical protein